MMQKLTFCMLQKFEICRLQKFKICITPKEVEVELPHLVLKLLFFVEFRLACMLQKFKICILHKLKICMTQKLSDNLHVAKSLNLHHTKIELVKHLK